MLPSLWRTGCCGAPMGCCYPPDRFPQGSDCPGPSPPLQVYLGPLYLYQQAPVLCSASRTAKRLPSFPASQLCWLHPVIQVSAESWPLPDAASASDPSLALLKSLFSLHPLACELLEGKDCVCAPFSSIQSLSRVRLSEIP